MSSATTYSDIPAGFSVVASAGTGAKPTPRYSDVPDGFQVVDGTTKNDAPSIAAPQPDYIGAIMRSNPLTSGIQMGIDAVAPGTSSTHLLEQGMSGVNRGLAHTVDLPLSIGPMIANFFGQHVQGPGIGDAIESGMAQTGMVKPRSDDLAGRLAESTGEGVGGALLPELGLTARAGGTIMDVLRGMFPAASSGLGGGIAAQVAPGNPAAEMAGQLIGGVVPSTVLSGVRAATRPLARTAAGDPVPRKLTAAVTRDGIPIDQVAQRVADLGPAGTVADLGDNTQKLAMGIATQPGAPGATISNSMRERAADAVNRVPAAINDVLGPATPPSQIAGDIQANMRTVGPEYDVTQNTPAPADMRPIAAALDQQITNTVGPAQAALRQIRESLDVPGTGQLSADPDKLLQVRQAIDGIVGSTQDGNVQRVLGIARRKIDDQLTTMFPGIEHTDARYRELARQRDALDQGANVLDGGKGAVWPTDNARAVADGVLPQGTLVGPSAATFRLSQGARADIERIVGTKTNDRVALANIMQGESDWNPQKLAQLFGQDRADRVMQIVQNERRMAETENLARTGSKTAAATAAQEDLEPGKGLSNVVRAGGWSVGNAGAHAAANVIDAITGGIATRRNQNVADVIMGRGDWRVAPPKPFYDRAQRDAMLAAVFGTAANAASRP